MPYQIYIVEDHPVMRRAYELVLGSADDLAVCGAAENAEEAWDVLQTSSCDLVITDVSLPGESGLVLLGRLHANRPALPVVVVSVQEDYRDAALDGGAQAFLCKDELAGALIPTLRAVLADDQTVA